MAENFSYISFGDWEKVEGEVEKVTMLRGRMFEYTPSDIEKRLESLDSDATEFLRNLPAFLCSEIASTGRNASMLIKYGRVTDIKTGRKEVSITFETIIDFGEVIFDDMDAARAIFNADKFQGTSEKPPAGGVI